MKKIIVLVVLVAAAAVPTVPYLIGTVVEKNFRIELQEAAEELAHAGFNIELVDYQRQLFTATATTRFSMMPDGEEKFSFDLHHNISHIPQIGSKVIANVDTELVLTDEIKGKVDRLFKDEVPLHIDTRIFLDGHQEADLYSPAVVGELSGSEAIAIEWKGIQGSAWQSAGRDKATFQMNMPGLVIRSAGTAPQVSESSDSPEATSSGDINPEVPVQQFGSMSISELQYDADMHKGQSGMWHGKAEASLEAFDINAIGTTGEPFNMHVNEVSLSGEQDEKNDLVQASGVLRSARISVNGFEATNATYDVAVENLDAQALRAWQLTASKLAQNDIDADPLAPLMEQLPALVDAKPVLRINNISVDTPMGRFAVSMDSRITGEWNDMLRENPAMIATMIRANLNASVPRTMVFSVLEANVRNAILAQNVANEMGMSQQQIEKAVQQSVSRQVDGLIGQGYVKANEAQLESRVEYNAGQLTINGMDASALMGTMLQ